MRESMLQATSLPNTGMVVTFDIGEPRLLHPRNKQAFSHRLALWARAEVYGQDIPWSGPTPARHYIDGDRIIVRFDHADGGLVAKGDALRGFDVSGEDGEWRTAQAAIEGNAVVVTHPGVAKPVALRYAWANHPDGNLFNGAGLPATPFRTNTMAPPREEP